MRARSSRCGARPWPVALLLVTLVTACASPSARSSPAVAPSPAGPVVRVASFDFAESRLLAEVYAQSLERHGLAVSRQLGLGPRELVHPALAQGLVDLVPEYAGSARRFLAATRTSAPHRSANDLTTLLEERGLVALPAATAQNTNALAVTRDTAREHGLRRVSDLAPHAEVLRFGGPPECAERPYCLPGLAERYGLRFAEFVPMTDYAVTVTALLSGEVDVGLLGSSDPQLRGRDLVALEDDRDLQPDEHVVPVARQDVVAAAGPALAEAVAEVSDRLTTAELVALNRSVVLDRVEPADAARRWLDAAGD